MRDFQRESIDKLSSGSSVLILAPTGLGKTRAALTPFINELHNKTLLGTRLIYSLPLRALARGVVDEFKELKPSLHVVTHHGDEPESEFFSERAVVTTVDQYLTAFAGAPLSWASHLSHAAAGAVLTSYSVFDEVHLLSPQKGLPLLFSILRLRYRWGLPSCVMTATLPPSVVKFFREFCGLEKIEASQNDIQQRDGWRKVLLQLVGNQTPSTTKRGKKGTKKNVSFQWEEITLERLCQIAQEKWDNWEEIDGPKKIIIFINTVDRAIQVYQKIKEAGFCPHVFLAHSRFTKQDRREVEEKIYKHFGRDAKSDKAILVTTQVAEAGLNISAPLVITELCPMDSLIQRAGRCQRFKPDSGQEMVGKVVVVKPSGEKWFVPYMDSIRLVEVRTGKDGKKKRNFSKPLQSINLTRAILEQEVNNSLFLNLDWKKEKELVKKALDKLYDSYLAGTTDIEFEKGEEPFQSLYNVYKSGKKGLGEEATEGEDEV